MSDSRLFVENKKLIAENQRLKEELSEQCAIVQLEQEERQLEGIRQSQKLSRVRQQATTMTNTCAQLKKDLLQLNKEFKKKSEDFQTNQSLRLIDLQQKIAEFASFQQDQ